MFITGVEMVPGTYPVTVGDKGMGQRLVTVVMVASFSGTDF